MTRAVVLVRPAGFREECIRVRAPIHRSSIDCHRFAPSGRGVAAPVVLPVDPPPPPPFPPPPPPPPAAAPLRRPHGLQHRGAQSTPPPRGRPCGCTHPRAAAASPLRVVVPQPAVIAA